MTNFHPQLGFKFLLLTAAALLLAACADGQDQRRADTFTFTSYNMGLALNFVPFTLERLVANESLLADYDSDVICLQEVWLEDSVNAIVQVLDKAYPHIYIEPPEQVFSEGAACTTEEVTGFAKCAREQCPGLTGPDLVTCGPVACIGFLTELSDGCLEGLIGTVDTPDVSVDVIVDTVTATVEKFAFEGSLGLILASKHELKNRQFLDFINHSSGNRRGALFAEIELNDTPHVVGCTHPTANLEATIPYPTSGRFHSWEEENRFMQKEMIGFVDLMAGDNPIFFGGDFNCSIDNAANSVDADYADNCQLWLDDGFADPAAEQLPCTYCAEENLLLKTAGGSGAFLLDHIFVKNLDTAAPIIADRVLDDPVSIEALDPTSELAPEDAPMLTHPSDHFGVKLNIVLPQ